VPASVRRRAQAGRHRRSPRQSRKGRKRSPPPDRNGARDCAPSRGVTHSKMWNNTTLRAAVAAQARPELDNVSFILVLNRALDLGAESHWPFRSASRTGPGRIAQDARLPRGAAAMARAWVDSEPSIAGQRPISSRDGNQSSPLGGMRGTSWLEDVDYLGGQDALLMVVVHRRQRRFFSGLSELSVWRDARIRGWTAR